MGTPRAVIVFVRTATGGAVTGVTYGGDTMTETASSPNDKSSGETGRCTSFFLGTSIPTGAQTVAVDLGGSDGGGYVYTLTATADTEVSDDDGTINSDSQSNPAVTMAIGGATSFGSILFFSGKGNVNNITPLTNWTARDERDLGAKTVATYSYDTIASSDFTCGWSQTADDTIGLCVAVSETAGAAPVPKLSLLGVGP